MELIIILNEENILVLTKEYIQKKFAGMILTVIQIHLKKNRHDVSLDSNVRTNTV